MSAPPQTPAPSSSAQLAQDPDAIAIERTSSQESFTALISSCDELHSAGEDLRYDPSVAFEPVDSSQLAHHLLTTAGSKADTEKSFITDLSMVEDFNSLDEEQIDDILTKLLEASSADGWKYEHFTPKNATTGYNCQIFQDAKEKDTDQSLKEPFQESRTLAAWEHRPINCNDMYDPIRKFRADDFKKAPQKYTRS